MRTDPPANPPRAAPDPSDLVLFRGLPPTLAQFTTTDNADLHTTVMQVFGEANERLETALTFDDVAAALPGVGWLDPVGDEMLERTLKALVSWSLLTVTQNHAARYATAEEYERRNLQYSLTKQGESAFEGVQHALASLTASGALQTAVLEAIASRLDELYWLLGTEDAEDRRLYVTLTELENHLTGCGPTPSSSTTSCSGSCATRRPTSPPSRRSSRQRSSTWRSSSPTLTSTSSASPTRSDGSRTPGSPSSTTGRCSAPTCRHCLAPTRRPAGCTSAR